MVGDAYTCKQCGTPLEVEATDRKVTCASCGSVNVIHFNEVACSNCSATLAVGFTGFLHYAYCSQCRTIMAVVGRQTKTLAKIEHENVTKSLPLEQAPPYFTVPTSPWQGKWLTKGWMRKQVLNEKYCWQMEYYTLVHETKGSLTLIPNFHIPLPAGNKGIFLLECIQPKETIQKPFSVRTIYYSNVYRLKEALLLDLMTSSDLMPRYLKNQYTLRFMYIISGADMGGAFAYVPIPLAGVAAVYVHRQEPNKIIYIEKYPSESLELVFSGVYVPLETFLNAQDKGRRSAEELFSDEALSLPWGHDYTIKRLKEAKRHRKKQEAEAESFLLGMILTAILVIAFIIGALWFVIQWVWEWLTS